MTLPDIIFSVINFSLVPWSGFGAMLRLIRALFGTRTPVYSQVSAMR
jgi:hypothetical protein